MTDYRPLAAEIGASPRSDVAPSRIGQTDSVAFEVAGRVEIGGTRGSRGVGPITSD